MIECVFTIDYEIYGNGEGSLRELVHEPTEELRAVFKKWEVPFVVFVEAAEFETIERHQSDEAMGDIRAQIVGLYHEGHEIGLHLHPQWYNARFEDGKWFLDYDEYNLCTLPKERIARVVERSISYLRNVLGKPHFTPVSFRAGNWLLQPTSNAANVLADHGIKVDSSVFKGGLQHQHKLDYRKALRNGYYWKFSGDVAVPDSRGVLLELPIYTHMVPFWKMLTTKRTNIQRRGFSGPGIGKQRLHRFADFVRFRYPLKFDFCRMTMRELTRMVDTVIREDQKDPASYRPLVAIGHTKDLVDVDTADSFLSYLRQKRIAVSTFEKIYDRCKC